jgi:hypothetical protein
MLASLVITLSVFFYELLHLSSNFMLFVDIVPDGLIDFLVRHLPKTMKDGNGNHCYTLALPNPFIAREIVKAGFALSTSPFDVEIMRGVRRNIEKVFEKMKLEDLEQSQVYLAQIYGKQKLDSPNKGKFSD